MKAKKTPTAAKTKKIYILIANGVNLDLLGQRESEWYGQFTLQDIEKVLKHDLDYFKTIIKNSIELEFFQSNDEKSFLEKLSNFSKKYSENGFAIINPGAWTHTSLSLGDRLAALPLKFIECHISNPARREEFRRQSYVSKHALGIISGFGIESYRLALQALLSL